MVNRQLPAIVMVAIALCLPAHADRANDAFKHGVQAEHKLDYDAAFTYYKQAYTVAPGNAKYLAAYIRMRSNAAQRHGHAGQLLRNTGALIEALAEFQRAVDIIGDASPERYAKALEIAAKDPNSDGMLVILTPQAMTDPTRIAEQLKPLAKQEGKPLLASWMGGVDVAAGEEILNRANIPTFPYPDTAARVFNYMWQYADNLKALYETPAMPEDSATWAPDRKLVESIISRCRPEGGTILTEFESKQVLAAYGIPVAKTIIAANQADAMKAADEIGYPIVLKLYLETITHKTDVGGVQLNLGTAEAVAKAFDAIQT